MGRSGLAMICCVVVFHLSGRNTQGQGFHEWSDWSSWSGCNAQCQVVRTRTCDDMNSVVPSYFQTNNCPGTAEEKRTCANCPIQMILLSRGWSEWSKWSHCSVSCGAGKRMRHRTCLAPFLSNAPPSAGRGSTPPPSVVHVGRQTRDSASRPSDSDIYCGGPHTQQQSCVEGACVTLGQWTGWSRWGPCSKYSKRGVSKRSRACFALGKGYLPSSGCLGEDREQRDCKTKCSRSLWMSLHPGKMTRRSGVRSTFTCRFASREVLFPSFTLHPVPAGKALDWQDGPLLTNMSCGMKLQWRPMLSAEHEHVTCTLVDADDVMIAQMTTRITRDNN